ncbi:DUF5786 family protein [Haloarcula sp. JP-L23]|uniref:DUF5786 family protein n=1 Tax=Haloarcula sp. JP-L23 TaxID=2716717 RepID=UPI00140EC53A|nr:hypothetical protein G9465_22865 [Haloarcula sp. JP-L23]
MGTFDEEEYERREAKISSVEADSDDQRTTFEGRVEFTGVDSVDDLLARLKDLKEE